MVRMVSFPSDSSNPVVKSREMLDSVAQRVVEGLLGWGIVSIGPGTCRIGLDKSFDVCGHCGPPEGSLEEREDPGSVWMTGDSGGHGPVENVVT